MDVEEKRTEVEIMQLRDGNPYNDKIKGYLIMAGTII